MRFERVDFVRFCAPIVCSQRRLSLSETVYFASCREKPPTNPHMDIVLVFCRIQCGCRTRRFFPETDGFFVTQQGDQQGVEHGEQNRHQGYSLDSLERLMGRGYRIFTLCNSPAAGLLSKRTYAGAALANDDSANGEPLQTRLEPTGCRRSQQRPPCVSPIKVAAGCEAMGRHRRECYTVGVTQFKLSVWFMRGKGQVSDLSLQGLVGLSSRRNCVTPELIKREGNMDAEQAEPTDGAPREHIELQQALKLANIVESGGQAKHMIQGGEVKVNGEVETRRRRKIYAGDVIEVDGEEYHIGE
jgi:ribosome-associated protein